MKDLGFCGKSPAHGDFIMRGLSTDFSQRWQELALGGMTYSREAVGAQWEDFWSTAPVWCFACGPGFLSQQSVYGVMVPSIDNVNREFPLALFWFPGQELSLFTVETNQFYEHAKRLLTTVLQDRSSVTEIEELIEDWLSIN